MVECLVGASSLFSAVGAAGTSHRLAYRLAGALLLVSTLPDAYALFSHSHGWSLADSGRYLVPVSPNVHSVETALGNECHASLKLTGYDQHQVIFWWFLWGVGGSALARYCARRLPCGFLPASAALPPSKSTNHSTP
jgi:hypothetical protein